MRSVSLELVAVYDKLTALANKPCVESFTYLISINNNYKRLITEFSSLKYKYFLIFISYESKLNFVSYLCDRANIASKINVTPQNVSDCQKTAVNCSTRSLMQSDHSKKN